MRKKCSLSYYSLHTGFVVPENSNPEIYSEAETVESDPGLIFFEQLKLVGDWTSLGFGAREDDFAISGLEIESTFQSRSVGGQGTCNR